MQCSKVWLFASVMALAACGESTEGTTGGGSGNLFTGGGSGSSSVTGGSAGTSGGGSATTTGGGDGSTGGGTASTTGGGDGSTGGGTASTTGGGTGVVTCREVTSWASTDVLAAGYGDEYAADGWFYDWVQAGYATATGTAGNGDYLEYSYWADSTTPSLPASGTVAGPYASCDHCAFIYEDCDTSDCARTYMGQSGSATVTTFTAADAGTFSVTLSDVTFVEWDTDNDVAIDGGACLHLAAQSMTGTW